MTFPSEFVWGVAASSYQIEGAARDDGKGASIWDTFCRVPGAVHGGHSGDVACDHYHRSGEDADLIAAVGARAYRLSISWPRVLPEGVGKVNEPGLAFYDRLVDALLERGVEPWITLFHWDYPQALQDRGGWLSPDSPEWFAEYTRVVVDRLSDRVTRWMTINEPQVFITAGWLLGVHAPGLALPRADVLLATHRMLLAHGRSVQTIRERARTPPIVGWAPVCDTHFPASGAPEDEDAARARTFSIIDTKEWAFNNTWYGDPVCLGHYPEDGLRLFGGDAPAPGPGEMETIAQPLDYYGANIYFGTPFAAGDTPVFWSDAHRLPGIGRSMMDWPITPPCLEWGPRFLHERYGLPIAITENGMACHDWVSTDGAVHDPQRIDYLARHLGALRRAIDAGAEVEAYFAWTFMDNFEWTAAYSKRFGLIHVDFETQTRTPKDSYHWYRGVIESNGVGL
jgi:beta-glucosidase